MIRREKRGPLWLTKRERPANFADRFADKGNFAALLRTLAAAGRQKNTIKSMRKINHHGGTGLAWLTGE